MPRRRSTTAFERVRDAVTEVRPAARTRIINAILSVLAGTNLRCELAVAAAAAEGGSQWTLNDSARTYSVLGDKLTG